MPHCSWPSGQTGSSVFKLGRARLASEKNASSVCCPSHPAAYWRACRSCQPWPSSCKSGRICQRQDQQGSEQRPAWMRNDLDGRAQNNYSCQLPHLMVPARPARSHLTTSLQSPPSESACTGIRSFKAWKELKGTFSLKYSSERRSLHSSSGLSRSSSSSDRADPKHVLLVGGTALQ